MSQEVPVRAKKKFLTLLVEFDYDACNQSTSRSTGTTVDLAPMRLKELHRVLKPTSSLHLPCDPIASHYLKVLLERILVFGITKCSVRDVMREA